MAETEVESILREIRERVLSGQRAGKEVIATLPVVTNRDNGAAESESQQTTHDNKTLIAENLSLIESYLTTTARAWDRVPPLVSNRSGFIARAELWLKRQLKRGTRWYTWEQVNFNAAVHHALRDLLPVLTAHEQDLHRLRAELEAHSAAAEARKTEAEARSAAAEARSAAANRQQAELRVELVNELREREQRLLEEQRVCFKQLALETSEAAVLEDRGRRKTEALLTELQRRVEQLEKGKK